MDEIAREAVTDETEMPAAGRRGRPKGPAEHEDRGVSGDIGAADELAAEPTEPAAAESGEQPQPITDSGELARVLLALLLVNREPISVLRLAQACGASQDLVRIALDQLAARLRDGGFPLEVSLAGDSVRLLTLPDVHPYVARLRGVKKAERLSPAALETLAVIAYRQPVLRAEIEAIRGVKAGPVLRNLLDQKLVSVTGRADVPGRPLQYGTTQKFLERFGLTSLEDLPSIKEFRSLG
jgi:segregation and condensation protein B